MILLYPKSYKTVLSCFFIKKIAILAKLGAKLEVLLCIGSREGIYALLCLVAQSCPTLCDPMDSSPPDSFVQGYSPS